MTIARHVKHASLALIALSSVGVLQGAYANGTASGTTISNQATVDYSVGGVNQTRSRARQRRSWSTPASTSRSPRLRRNATQTHPGQANVVTTFQRHQHR